ncbi:MAG: ATPase [Cyanobacteria bacterium RM1_2_2]|nr:ATPase [Cyanobacteria bacterium RM1_2_2]
MTVSRTVCLGFAAVITLGTLLLMLPFATSSGTWNDPLVALFTATSAVCVTGHIVVDTATYFSTFGHVVILSLIQVGGLGYMTATTFLLLLLGRRFGLRDKIAVQQTLDREGLQGTTGLIRSIIALTVLAELTGTFLLMSVFVPDHGLGRGLWLSFFHSISAWNNAGFSLFSDGLVGYQASWMLNLVIPVLIIFGGIGYEVIFEMYLWLRDQIQRKSTRIVFSLNFKVAVSTTLALLILGTIAFWLSEYGNSRTLSPMSPSAQFLAAWFQSVTTRTAGFNTIDNGALSPTALVITIALMFVGGNPGGTAGGLKTTTLRILTSCTKAILQGREEVYMYQRQIPPSLILKAVGVAVGSLFVVILMTTLITISDPKVDFIRILFEVISGFCTVGLSTGITAGLSSFAKLVLVATMYIGRVGVLLLMSAILGDPTPSAVRYPEENLLVG